MNIVVASTGSQFKESTPAGIFSEAVAFFGRHGIENFQPAKLSKEIRDSFRKGGVSAATEAAQKHANMIARRLYREGQEVDVEMIRNAFGHTDLTPAMASKRIAEKKNVPAPAATGTRTSHNGIGGH